MVGAWVRGAQAGSVFLIRGRAGRGGRGQNGERSAGSAGAVLGGGASPQGPASGEGDSRRAVAGGWPAAGDGAVWLSAAPADGNASGTAPGCRCGWLGWARHAAARMHSRATQRAPRRAQCNRAGCPCQMSGSCSDARDSAGHRPELAPGRRPDAPVPGGPRHCPGAGRPTSHHLAGRCCPCMLADHLCCRRPVPSPEPLAPMRPALG